MHKLVRIWSVFFALVTTTCVAVPLPSQPGGVDENKIKSVKVGQTSKKQVLTLLGRPNALDAGNSFVYSLITDRTYAALINPLAPGQSPEGIYGKFHRLLLEFDDHNIVRRVQDLTPHKPHQTCAGVVRAVPGDSTWPHKDIGPKAKILRGKLAWDVSFSSDGQTLLAGADNQLTFWDIKSTKKFKTLIGREWSQVPLKGGVAGRIIPNLISISTTPNGQFAAAVGHKKTEYSGASNFIEVASVFNLGNEREIITAEQPKAQIGGGGLFSPIFQYRFGPRLVSLDPLGRFGAIAGLEKIQVWNLKSGRVVSEIKTKPNFKILAASFNGNGDVLFVASRLKREGRVEAWDWKNSQLRSSLVRTAPAVAPAAIDVAGNGKSLAIYWGSHIEIWQTGNGEVGARTKDRTFVKGFGTLKKIIVMPWVVINEGYSMHTHRAPKLSLSNDGNVLAIADNRVASVWDSRTAEILWRSAIPYQNYSFGDCQFSWHPDKKRVLSVAISPDGRTLAVARGDGVGLVPIEPR